MSRETLAQLQCRIAERIEKRSTAVARRRRESCFASECALLCVVDSTRQHVLGAMPEHVWHCVREHVIQLLFRDYLNEVGARRAAGIEVPQWCVDLNTYVDYLDFDSFRDVLDRECRAARQSKRRDAQLVDAIANRVWKPLFETF